MVMWKMVRNINLALPEELLAEVDEAAKRHFMSRSEYIRAVLHKAILRRPKDEKYERSGDEPWLYDLDDS